MLRIANNEDSAVFVMGENRDLTSASSVSLTVAYRLPIPFNQKSKNHVIFHLSLQVRLDAYYMGVNEDLTPNTFVMNIGGPGITTLNSRYAIKCCTELVEVKAILKEVYCEK